MCHANNEKWKKTNNGRNRTTKSGKNQNDQRKGNLQVIGNIGSGHYRTSGDERKIKKEDLTQARKQLETKLCKRNLIKWVNTWVGPPCMILGSILEMDEGRTQTNGPEDKKDNDDTQCLTSGR